MTTSERADIREWARAAGMAVGDRDRLSPHIIAAYNDAHADAPASSAAVATAPQEPPRTNASPGKTVRAKQYWDETRREGQATSS